MLEEGGEIPEDKAWGASTAWAADATAATKAGSSVIVEVGGGTGMATLAATDDTTLSTEGAVVDGKAALEDTKKLADRLLLVRRVVPESPSILHKRPKANEQGET